MSMKLSSLGLTHLHVARNDEPVDIMEHQLSSIHSQEGGPDDSPDRMPNKQNSDKSRFSTRTQILVKTQYPNLT